MRISFFALATAVGLAALTPARADYVGQQSVTLSGFTPTPSYSQLAFSDTASHRTAIPTGAVDVIYNTSSGVAYCAFGSSSVTAAVTNDAVQGNSWMALTVPSGVVDIACIAPGGTLAINVSGGSGIPTGAGGGGSSGGGGGAVTLPTSSITVATGNGTVPTVGGTAVSVSNPFPVSPGTSAVFQVQSNSNNLATAANQPTAAGQGSSTAGETGALVQGAVTTSAPTYTTAQTSPLSLDTAGNLRVNVVSPTAAAQGSTTSGQTGPLAQGAVTTSAPSYTTAQTSPLSLDTTGNLRVSGAVTQGSTTSSQTGPLIQGAVTTSAPAYTTAQTSPLSLDVTGNLRVVSSANHTDVTGVTSAVQALGTGALATDSHLTALTSANHTDTTAVTSAVQALGTGALATSANQTNATQKTQIVDGSGNVISSAANNLNIDTPSGSALTTLLQAPSQITQSSSLTNPTYNSGGGYQLASNTAAYGSGNLMANSGTAGSVTVPTLAIAHSGGGAYISRLRLFINDGLNTAFTGMTIQIDLWSAAPAFGTGDHTAYSPNTNLQTHLGAFTCVMGPNYGTGTINATLGLSGEFAECSPTVGGYVNGVLASGVTIYWTAWCVNAGSTSALTSGGASMYLTGELTN